MDMPVDADKRSPGINRAIAAMREQYEEARVHQRDRSGNWMWRATPTGQKMLRRGHGQKRKQYLIALYALQEEIGREVVVSYDREYAVVNVPVQPTPEQILDAADAARRAADESIVSTWKEYLEWRDLAEQQASDLVAMADAAKEWAAWWQQQPTSPVKSREWMRCNRLAQSLANVTPMRKPQRADRHALRAALESIAEVGGGVKNVAYRDWLNKVDRSQSILATTIDSRAEQMKANDKAEEKLDLIAAKVAGAQQALKYRAMVDEMMEVAA